MLFRFVRTPFLVVLFLSLPLVFSSALHAEEQKAPVLNHPPKQPPRAQIPPHPQRPGTPHGPSGRVESFMLKLQSYKGRLAKDPKDLEALIFLANAHFDIQRFEKAKGFYLKVLEIDPNNLHVRTDLASIYRNLKESDKAVETLRVVLSLNPNHEVALYNIGVILLNDQNDPNAAAEVWQRLITINPNDPLAKELTKKVSAIREGKLTPTLQK